MNIHLLTRIIFFHLAACIGIFVWFATGGSFLTFLVLLFLCLFFQMVGTIGFHRWLAHRAFEPSTHGKIILMIGMLIESLGKPIISATVHRAHHINSDKDGDPHSPRSTSFGQMLLGQYKTSKTLPPIRDMLRQQDLVWFNTHYWKLWIILNILIALIDWRLVLLICPLTFCKSRFMGQHVNYFAHGGKKCIPTNSNNLFLVMFSGGEHLHANHHSQPGNWRFDTKGTLPDPSAFIIKYLGLRKI